jgi:CBS domain-containing protein
MRHGRAGPTVVVMPIDVPLTARLDLVVVRDVMHPGVISCTADTPLVEVARTLGSEQVHCVVVSDVERTSAGKRLRWSIVETDDLVRALATPGAGPLAGDLATPPATTVAPSDTVAEALALMVSSGASHLIVEERGYPVGVLSALDIARAAGGH